MAFVDDPNSNSQDNQVAGATPLGNTAPAQQGSDTSSQGSQGDSQPSTIQSDGQPATTNKKAKKASSGMYTNIQKYVEKNKPQAQNMANAVSQDVGKQAEQIRQSVEAQKDQQSKVLQSNQQAIQSGSDWAKQQVGNIMAPTEQAQPYSPSEADITKFQGLMQGNVQGLQKVGDLNIADQSAKARALQSLAQSTNTEQGRRNLLGQTFQKQGEYGRGMSGLDNLITSGDINARQSLIQGTQGQAQGLQDDVQGALKQYGDEKAAQELAAKNIGTDVTGLGTEAVSGIDTSFQTSYDDELAKRRMLEGVYDQSVTSADKHLSDVKSQLEGTAYGDTIESLLNPAYDASNTKLSDVQYTNLEAYVQALKEGRDVNDIGVDYRPVMGGGNDTVATNPWASRQIMGSLLDQINKKYKGNELYDVQGVDSDLTTDQFSGQNVYDRLAGSQSQLLDQFNSLGTGTDVVNKAVQGLSGQSFQDYVSGQGLDKYDTASDEDVSKYNTLQKLMGKNETIGSDKRQTDFTQSQALQDLLSRYGSAKRTV